MSLLAKDRYKLFYDETIKVVIEELEEHFSVEGEGAYAVLTVLEKKLLYFLRPGQVTFTADDQLLLEEIYGDIISWDVLQLHLNGFKLWWQQNSDDRWWLEDSNNDAKMTVGDIKKQFQKYLRSTDRNEFEEVENSTGHYFVKCLF